MLLLGERLGLLLLDGDKLLDGLKLGLTELEGLNEGLADGEVLGLFELLTELEGLRDGDSELEGPPNVTLQ